MATRMQPHRDFVIVPDVRADRAEPLEKDGTITKLGIDATRRAGDRADWQLARPPQAALERARELLRAHAIPQLPNETKSQSSLMGERVMLYRKWRTSMRPMNLLMGVAAVALGFAAAQPARAEIKIGFQAPLTGFAATDGKSAKIAAEMAIDDINAAGGVLGQKLQLIIYDDQAKSDQAIFTANKLIGEDGVKLVVNGSYSASGRAAAPVFQKAGVVMIVRLWRASGHHQAPATISSAWFTSGRRKAAPPRCSSARTSA